MGRSKTNVEIPHGLRLQHDQMAQNFVISASKLNSAIDKNSTIDPQLEYLLKAINATENTRRLKAEKEQTNYKIMAMGVVILVLLSICAFLAVVNGIMQGVPLFLWVGGCILLTCLFELLRTFVFRRRFTFEQ